MNMELRAVPVNIPVADPFDDFWCLYPKHIAKKDARKAWTRIPESLHNQIFTSLVAWRAVWRDAELEFLPHGATWLNGERWEDELPAEFVRTHAAHVRAVLPSAERGEMPEHVRAVLAKLRGRP